jgi:hypothetical protein
MRESLNDYLIRSPQPENPANHAGEDWQESNEVCPDCGQLLWEALWWDDELDCGGAAIGALLKCGECGWFEAR